MKKFTLILLLALLVSLWVVLPAFAAPAPPAGTCRRGFTMDTLANNPAAPTGTDRNGDGYICTLQRGPGNTLYIDNFNKVRCRGR